MIVCHAFRTALLQVKKRHREARFQAPWLRHLDLALDPSWTDPLPVWSWVLEHPEGLIVVDAGASPTAWQPDHFDAANRFVFKHFFRFHQVDPLAAQMRRAGLNPERVRLILQTHLHFDHPDGLCDFPEARVLVSRAEWEFHQRTPQGSALPRWRPERFTPVDFPADAWKTFPQSFAVTQAGDVRLVPTPGHTPGHQSVVVETGEATLFLAGDLTFDLAQTQSPRLPGISWSLPQNRSSLQRLLPLLKQGDIVYLASHDPVGYQ